MAKTYILEPTELVFSYIGDDTLEFEDDFVDIIDGENLENSILEVDGYSFKVKYAGLTDGSATFTEDGTIPESAPITYALISSSGNIVTLKSTTLPTEDCTLTVSIYTGEDDPEPTPGSIPGLEDKNVVYEYQLVANNNIKDILMAVMEKNGDNAVNIPGYSVMELLVENLLVFHYITDEKLATFRATSFANDVEKIAWIIRNATIEN